MHPSTKSQIRHIMSDFGETKHHLLHDRVVALAASRWMMPVNNNAINSDRIAASCQSGAFAQYGCPRWQRPVKGIFFDDATS